MFKRIKMISTEISKFKSQWKEVGEKLEERKELSKNAATMLDVLLYEFSQYKLESTKLLRGIHTEEFVHLSGEAHDRYFFAKDKVEEIEAKIINN